MKNRDRDQIYSGASQEQIAIDLEPLVNFEEQGLSQETLAKLIEERLVPHLMQYDHPSFQSLFNYFPEEGAEFGARIALAYNQGVTNWQVSPGAVMLEELCCKALCRIFGLSQTADATFMYSGTYANQEALYLALHWKAGKQGFDLTQKGLQGFRDPGSLKVVASQDAHFSLKHALRILGLGEESLITLAVDENHRLDVERAEKAINEIREKNDIFCVVATAGTTSTGSVDPVSSIDKIRGNLEAWLHVDGAYGLAYSLVPDWQPLFSGVELADSISWDPHKQFGVPIPSSLLFVRRREEFERMAVYSGYFNRREDTKPNPGLKSPPSTRPFAALSLVTSMRYQGMKKLIKRLHAPLIAIKTLAENLKNEPDIELCHYPDTGILCFRITPEGFPDSQLDKLQLGIYNKIVAEGKRSISLTELDGKPYLRLVAISPSLTGETLMGTISVVRDLARELKFR